MVPIFTPSPVATYFLELKYTKIRTIQKTAIIPQTTIQVMYTMNSWHTHRIWRKKILLNIGWNACKWFFFASIDDDSDGDDTENEQDNTNDNVNESNDDSLNCEKTTALDIKSKNDAPEDKIQTTKLTNNSTPDTKPQNGDISTTSNGVDSVSPNASHQD